MYEIKSHNSNVSYIFSDFTAAPELALGDIHIRREKPVDFCVWILYFDSEFNKKMSNCVVSKLNFNNLVHLGLFW